MSQKPILPYLLTFVSASAIAAEDPGGVVPFLMLLALGVPLVILLAVGWIAGGAKGMGIALLVYAVGIGLLLFPPFTRDLGVKSDIRLAREAQHDSCLMEAGELIASPDFAPSRILVSLHANTSSSLPKLQFNAKDSSAQVEYVNSTPAHMHPSEVLVRISNIKRAIRGTDNRHLVGYETIVHDSAGKLLAKRVNFVGCFHEIEEQAIERLLRRTLGLTHVLLKSSHEGEELVLAEYPIAAISQAESGSFVPNRSVHTGIPRSVLTEWGCTLEEKKVQPFDSVNPYSILQDVKCPRHVEIGPQFKYQVDLGNRWLLVGEPYSVSDREDAELGGLVVEERDRQGSILGRWLIRLPRPGVGSPLDLEDAQMIRDRIKLTWVFAFGKGKRDSDGNKTFGSRLRMEIPVRHAN
ncbi:MAG: hypothetical protein Q8M11_20055 [Sulfuritalea sp.]|nr:hypothetical protein [Sulfuritalea sp.]MDP1985275.1 hypothetical protein [Sulfuritalea sp.]